MENNCLSFVLSCLFRLLDFSIKLVNLKLEEVFELSPLCFKGGG